MAYKLRDYQVQAVERTRAELAAGKRSVVIVAPTGAGKTVIASHIIERAAARGSRTLFLAHRTELIEQCSSKLKENGIRHGIIKAGFHPDPFAQVQVASVQTYTRRAAKLDHGYKLVIIDEAHHAVAESYQQVLRANPGATVLGLTATPYRADGKGLKGTFESLVEVSTINALVSAGHLVPSRVFIGQKIKGLDKVHTLAGDYKTDELAEVMNQTQLVNALVQAWLRLSFGRLSVVFATNVAHSKAIAQAFTASGIRCEHLDGETPADERKAILERHAAGKTQIVSNCGVLTEGWDQPACSTIILARPTKSRGLWRQMIGRCLRPAPLKTNCLILDHGNCTDTHGFITDPDKISLEFGMQVEQPKAKFKCKSCGAVLNSRPRYCPSCGLDTAKVEQSDLFGPGEDPAYEMIEVRPETYKPKPKKTMAVSDILYLKDLKTAREKGYKPGWADHRYRIRTGRYPSAELSSKSSCPTRIHDGHRVWADNLPLPLGSS